MAKSVLFPNCPFLTNFLLPKLPVSVPRTMWEWGNLPTTLPPPTGGLDDDGTVFSEIPSSWLKRAQFISLFIVMVFYQVPMKYQINEYWTIIPRGNKSLGSSKNLETLFHQLAEFSVCFCRNTSSFMHCVDSLTLNPHQQHCNSCPNEAHLHPCLLLHMCVWAQPLVCLTLYDLMDCSLPGSTVQGIFQAKNTEVGCHFLLQGIFPTQGLNLHLLQWQADSLPLSHLGSPYFSIRHVRTFLHLGRLHSGSATTLGGHLIREVTNKAQKRKKCGTEWITKRILVSSMRAETRKQSITFSGPSWGGVCGRWLRCFYHLGHVCTWPWKHQKC